VAPCATTDDVDELVLAPCITSEVVMACKYRFDCLISNKLVFNISLSLRQRKRIKLFKKKGGNGSFALGVRTETESNWELSHGSFPPGIGVGAKLAAAVPALVDKRVVLRSQKLEATSFPSACLFRAPAPSSISMHCRMNCTLGRKKLHTHAWCRQERAQGQDKNAD
jgi:hypothetical protein